MNHSPVDRTFNRAYISMHDMEKCIEYLQCAKSALANNDFAAARGLITAAIVSYARPFSGNEDHPSAVPKPSFRSKQLTSQERELHNRVITLRNEAIAHSDATMNPVKADIYSHNGYVASSRLYDPLNEISLLPRFELLANKAKGIFAGATMAASRQGAQDTGAAP